MKKATFLFLFCITSYNLKAQIVNPVKWSYGSKQLNAKEAVVFFKATIDPGWHIYSQKGGKSGPTKTEFSFAPATTFATVGPTTEPKLVSKFEKVIGMQVNYFEREVIFSRGSN